MAAVSIGWVDNVHGILCLKAVPEFRWKPFVAGEPDFLPCLCFVFRRKAVWRRVLVGIHYCFACCCILCNDRPAAHSTAPGFISPPLFAVCSAQVLQSSAQT